MALIMAVVCSGCNYNRSMMARETIKVQVEILPSEDEPRFIGKFTYELLD